MLANLTTSPRTVKVAILLAALAWFSFVFPFFWTYVLRLYMESLGVCFIFYVLFAIAASIASLVASWRGQWRYRHAGKLLLLLLFVPLPVIIWFYTT